MRIAPDLFERILHSPNESEAVHQLDGFWCARPGRHADQPWFGLTPVEFRVHLFVLYMGEVGNGGHWQYFANPSGRYAADTVNALENLHLPELRAILANACLVFPDGDVPPDDAARERVVDAVGEAARGRWQALDQEVYTAAGSFWKRALEYLQAHEGEVLVGERE